MARRKLIGTSGNDVLNGTSRDDLIYGLGGNDRIFAGAGDDVVYGDTGNDELNGEDGDDELAGLAGDDIIRGGAGNDDIEGGSGNDTIEDGLGSDEVDGGSGDDLIIWRPGQTRDKDELDGGRGHDTLQLEFTAAQWANSSLRSDVTRLQAFMAATQGQYHGRHERSFDFRSYKLEVSNFEKLIVKVDGVAVIGGQDTTAPDVPTLLLSAASDSGAAGDRITSDATPTLNGQAEAGATVNIREGSQILSTVTAASNGTWSATLPTLSDGTHGLTATATDSAGNTSAASAVLSLVIDTQAPAIPVIDLTAAGDSGDSNTDNLTNAASVDLVVQAEAGTSVTLGSQTKVATGGSANFTVSLVEGANNFTASATDAAGNIRSGTLTIQRDSSAPTTPTLSLAAASDSGTAGDGLTQDTTPTITGQAEAGALVTIHVDSIAAGSVRADASGAWSFTMGSLSDGAHSITASARDAAGNASPASAALALTVDTAAPNAPALDLADTDDSGVSASDNLTSKASVTVSIAAETGSTVHLGSQSAVASGGAASFTIALNEGVNALSATATDAAGNVSGAGTLSITRDSTAPDAPTITLDAASDTGTQGDGSTTDTTPTLSGSAEAGALVSISGSDGELGHVTADNTGQWSFTTGTLATGSYALTAQAQDAAGNASAPSTSFALIIAPTVTPGTLSLALAVSDRYQGHQDQSGAGLVTLAGTGTPGETVRLFDGQGVELAHSIVDVRGGFRFNEVHLAMGANTLSVQSFAGSTATGTLGFDVQRVDDLTNTNMVLEWVQTALQIFAAEATTPTAGSRALAMIGQAMYNVVGAINHAPGYQFTALAPDGASLDAAIAQAAHDVLKSIYPGSAAALDAKLANVLGTIADGAAETDGSALGHDVASRVIALRADDGWNDVVTFEGQDKPGVWQPTGPAYAGALDPQWAKLDTFVMAAPDAFDPGSPPEVGSPEWIAAYNQVKELGASDSTMRTADQTESVRFWAQGVGTSTPAGLWAQIALEASKAGDISVANTALLFAQLGLAEGDAGIAAWNSKYAYSAWRPVTAIQDADLLGSPAIVSDRDWTPYVLTPPFPEYVSGHSTFSAAAGQVLEDFFGQNYAFSTSVGSFTRSFSSFDDAVEEAGMSRIYGGIHFSFSDASGQETGRAVGSLVSSVFNGADDLHAPTIIFDTDPGQILAGDFVIAGAVADDLSGVARLFWSLDGGSLTPLTSTAQGNFSFSTGAGLADGKHVVTIFAQDAVGHSSARDFSFTTSTHTTDIVLEAASIQSGATLTAPGELVGHVDLGAGNALRALSYSIDGGTPISMVFGADGHFETPLDLAKVALGQHNIVISATDALGNVVQETLAVTVSSLPFTVTALTPDRYEADVGVTYRPSVSFSRAFDPATLTADSFYVTDSSGAKIPATIVPYKDGTGAWLLFDDAMPGAQRMSIHLEGNAIRSVDGTTLDANGADPGVNLERHFTTVSTAGVAGTSITGIVLDPGADFEPGTRDDVLTGPNGLNDFAHNTYLNPLAGVKVYILGREDLFAITDANGRFTLENTPIGNVKLVVEGRTATNAPAGFFFPEMVMELNVKAGVVNTAMSAMGPRDAQLDNIGNEALYLPRIEIDTVQAVSTTEATVIHGDSIGGTGLTQEQASRITLTVQPGSFVDAQGQAVTNPQIGIAPVPSSLVRDMLPPGVVNHSFDFTIQAPGTSVFTQEVQMTLPNVFNLAPGTKTNVLSFDHTTGRLVLDGTATVSADGLTVTTDPGSGITAPGWHGITDGSSFGHVDASVLCGNLSPATLNGQDVVNAGLEATGLVSTGAQLLQRELNPAVAVPLAAAGVAADIDAVDNSLRQLALAQTTGDTGLIGGEYDTEYKVIKGLELVKGLGKTFADIGGMFLAAIPAPAKVANPAFLALDLLNFAHSLIDVNQNLFLTGTGPADKILTAGRKYVDAANAAQTGVPGWKPPVNLKTPPAEQALETAVNTAAANAANRVAVLNNVVSKLEAIQPILESSFNPDGTLKGGAEADILNHQDALLDALNAVIDAARPLETMGNTTDEIMDISEALSDVQEAFDDDIAALIAEIADEAGGVDPNADTPGTAQNGDTLYYVLSGPRPEDEQRGTFSAAAGLDLVFQGSAIRNDGEIIPRGYSLTIIDPATHSVSRVGFTANTPGLETKIGAATLLPSGEGLQANGYSGTENYVLGLNGNITDNLVPGVPDAVALKDGLVGTNGLVNGSIASLDLANTARAMVLDASGSNAQGLHAYLATSDGLSVVDLSNANAPKLAAQLHLDGAPSDIAIDKATGLVAVAAGAGGVWLVDISKPDTPTVFARITENATQVEVVDGIAYFASGGFLRAYDMGSTRQVAALNIGASPVSGMAVDGDVIYVLRGDGTIQSFAANDGAVQLLGSLSIPEFASASHLTVANGILYVPRGDNPGVSGFATIDVHDPAALALISDRDSQAVAGGAMALVSAGSAVGVQSVVLPTPLGNRIVDSLAVIDTSDPAVNDALVRRYELGGAPVDVAVARGLAFVITAKGLEVVRYAQTDTAGIPPVITVDPPTDLDAALPGIQYHEGERISFAPRVSDDSGVRQVEMLINGVVVSTDVSYPYGLTAMLPTIAENGGNATVQISFRAIDTGGNVAVDPGFSITLVEDTTPFTIVSTTPVDEGALAAARESLIVVLSKPVDPNTVTVENFAVTDSGGRVVQPDSIELRNGGATVKLNFAGLNDAHYAFLINAPAIKDLAGHVLGATPVEIDFTGSAYTNIWVGGGTGDWFDAANWSATNVPSATDDVYISLPNGANIATAGPRIIVDTLTTAGAGTLAIGNNGLTASSVVNDGGLTINGGNVAPGGGLSTGLLDNSGTFTVAAGGDARALGSLVNSGNIVIAPYGILTSEGNIDNSGTITLTKPADVGFGFLSNPILSVKGTDVQLTGGGTIALQQDENSGTSLAQVQGIRAIPPEFGDNVVLSQGAVTVLRNVDNHITGAGRFVGEMTIINEAGGEIRAGGVGGSLTSPTDDFRYTLAFEMHDFSFAPSFSTIIFGHMVNHGLIHAADDAQIRFKGVIVDNTGGTIIADGQYSVIDLAAGAVISGGTISAGTNGGIYAESGSLLKDIHIISTGVTGTSGSSNPRDYGLYGDVRLQGAVVLDGTLNPVSGTVLTLLGGTFTNHGIAFATADSVINVAGEQTLNGGGSLFLFSVPGQQGMLQAPLRNEVDPDTDAPLPALHLVNMDNQIRGSGIIGGLTIASGTVADQSGTGVGGRAVERFVIENRAGGLVISTETDIALTVDGVTIQNDGRVGSFFDSRMELLNTVIAQSAIGQIEANSGVLRMRSVDAQTPIDPADPSYFAPTSVTGGIVNVLGGATLETVGNIHMSGVSLYNFEQGTITIKPLGLSADDPYAASGALYFGGGTLINSGTITVQAGADPSGTTGLDARFILDVANDGDTVFLLNNVEKGHLILASSNPLGTAHIGTNGHIAVLENETNIISGTGVIDAEVQLNIRNAGELVINAGDDLTNNASFTNNDGLIAVRAGTTIDDSLIFNNRFDNFGIVSDDGAGALIFNSDVINFGSFASHDGAGDFSFNARLENNETVRVENGGLIHFNGQATGTGSYDIGAGGGTLDINSLFDGLIDASGGDGVIQIDDLLNFHGSITGFGSGDSVKMDAIDFASAVISQDSVVGQARMVTISDGTDSVTLQFDAAMASPLTLQLDPLDGAGTVLAI